MDHAAGSDERATVGRRCRTHSRSSFAIRRVARPLVEAWRLRPQVRCQEHELPRHQADGIMLLAHAALSVIPEEATAVGGLTMGAPIPSPTASPLSPPPRRFADAVSLAGRAERSANGDPVSAAVILTYSFYARLLAGEPCDGERLAAAVPVLVEAGDHEAAAHALFLYILFFGGIDPARVDEHLALVERGGNTWVRHDLVAITAA